MRAAGTGPSPNSGTGKGASDMDAVVQVVRAHGVTRVLESAASGSGHCPPPPRSAVSTGTKTGTLTGTQAAKAAAAFL